MSDHDQWPGWKQRLLAAYQNTIVIASNVAFTRYPDTTQPGYRPEAYEAWVAELNGLLRHRDALRQIGLSVGIPVAAFERAEWYGMRGVPWEELHGTVITPGESIERIGIVDEIVRDVGDLTQMAILAAEHAVEPFPSGSSDIVAGLAANMQIMWSQVNAAMRDIGLSVAERDSLWQRDGASLATAIEVLTTTSTRSERETQWAIFSHPEDIGDRDDSRSSTAANEHIPTRALVEEATRAWRDYRYGPQHDPVETAANRMTLPMGAMWLSEPDPVPEDQDPNAAAGPDVPDRRPDPSAGFEL
ncbi:hypothetical protein [Nocardia bhagyanarayanae]|uniref:Uncharacterized protein n=1 Tax=Nocardia bhagyanarayanae TaxID=1215925 RepID=A0A543FFP9_9NOCA|nr:hypothetical protein [Nocardia bhagyanarayanae]TQM32690.1 hypothetical protein FB390_4385 [Nocardia bhagyanarayanae]